MQTGVAHLRNALCWQESFYLIEKQFGSKIFRQVFASLSGLHLDVRCAVVGELPNDDVPVGLGVELVGKIPDIPDVAVFHDFPCRQRDSLTAKDFVGAFDSEDNVCICTSPCVTLATLGSLS